MDKTGRTPLGCFGNVWIRQNYLAKPGDESINHHHYFDHVTLLSQGKVRVDVNDVPGKEFTAPTFIMIKKDKKHKFVALTEDVTWFCIFALRDEEGGLTDHYNGDNSPYMWAPDSYWDTQEALKHLTIEESEVQL